jgi:hypothetical protein
VVEVNQTLELGSRENIDEMLERAGWHVQDKAAITNPVRSGCGCNPRLTARGGLAPLWPQPSRMGEGWRDDYMTAAMRRSR